LESTLKVLFLKLDGNIVRRDAPHKFLSGKQRYSVLVLTIFLILNAFFSANISFAKSSDNSVVCNVFFAQPMFEDIILNDNIFTQIKMQDCVPFAVSSGDPSLPVYAARILVPNGKKVSDVSVSNSPFVLIKNDLVGKPVVPQQAAFPFSVDSDEKNFVINERLYESDEPVFENIFSIGSLGFCRGYEILTIFLYPAKYIPKDGLLYYTNKMTVTVSFKDSVLLSNSNNFFRESENDEQVVASIVENPDDVVTYGSEGGIFSSDDQTFGYSGGICNSSKSYEYVIITSNSLKDTTGYDYNWSDLLSHRENYSGLSGIIVSVEEINACSAYYNQTALFNDTQAHIREFCKDAYQDWNTDYVLLAGDWDSDSSHQIVPYRLFTDRFEALDYDNMACDLYYSHLDGDWYHSNSGYWGGGLDSGVNDYYSELFVGRITVSNAEMVSNAVNKIINYDTNDSLSDSWLRTVSFWGGDLGWDATSKAYMEEIRLGTDMHRTFTGFQEFNTAYPDYAFNTSKRLYHKDLGPGYRTYFENSVENDDASIINHLDHSSWTEPLSLSTWDSLSNTKPFLGFSQGCLAGRYQSGEAGCEKLICKYSDKHAYALVLNTGYGYGSGSSTNGASQYMMAYFWDYFLNNQSDNHSNWQLGKAMAYSQDKMAAVIASSSPAWCYTWYSTHFFGDPAQTLRLNCTYSNNPVSQASPNPSDGSSGVSVGITNLSIILSDNDGDVFNWSIQTSPDVGNSSGFNDTAGNKSCNVSGLLYSTLYTWFVNVSDGTVWCNETYVFTTVAEHVNSAPSIDSVSPVNGSIDQNLSLNWSVIISDFNGDSFNYTIECSNGESNSSNDVNNATFKVVLTGLQYNTTYTVWVNVTDGFDYSRTWYIFTTKHMPIGNYAPMISDPDPSNDSKGVSVSLSILQVTINDTDGDVFNWSIQTSPDIGVASGVDASNGSVSCSVSDLSYSTLYTWFVNVFDGSLWCNESFVFTTASKPVSSHSGGNGGYVSNVAPVAVAGGPYSGFVNETIIFNGSKSSDSDGSIAAYSWSFGDGNTGLGVSVSHVYSASGSYTITLTVTDDDSATDTDVASVTIQENVEIADSTNNSSEEISVSDNDSDSTFVSDDVVASEIKELFNLGDDTKIEKVNALGTSQYLIDSDDDGTFDVFYDYKTGLSTNAKSIDDRNYLLDVDDDGVWDYKYNILSDTLSAYSPILEQDSSKEFVIYSVLIFVIVLVVGFVLLIVIVKKRSSLPGIGVHPSFERQHVHFFSKDKHGHINVKKVNKRYKHVHHQNIYSESNKSYSIYDSSLTSDIVSSLNKSKTIAPRVYEIDPALDDIRGHAAGLTKTRANMRRSSIHSDSLVDDILFSKHKDDE
jgi:chitodextrinase